MKNWYATWRTDGVEEFAPVRPVSSRSPEGARAFRAAESGVSFDDVDVLAGPFWTKDAVLRFCVNRNRIGGLYLLGPLDV